MKSGRKNSQSGGYNPAKNGGGIITSPYSKNTICRCSESPGIVEGGVFDWGEWEERDGTAVWMNVRTPCRSPSRLEGEANAHYGGGLGYAAAVLACSMVAVAAGWSGFNHSGITGTVCALDPPLSRSRSPASPIASVLPALICMVVTNAYGLFTLRKPRCPLIERGFS